MKTKSHFLWAGLVLGLIHSTWAQPIIIQQPQNQTNVAGTTATFSVFIIGILPVSYQWRSYSPDGSSFTDIPFAVNATYVLPNVQPTTNLFAVVVTDGSGLSVTSSPLVTLTVLVPPVITMQPQSQTNVVGSMVTLAVEAGGTPPLSYQWRRNSANLAGKTDPTLVFTNLQTGNAGSYTVVVTNMEGAVTSVVAFVRVLVPPSITSQPATQLVVVGSTVTFAVTAAGTAPLGYQWRFNDVNLAGQITTSLVLANAQRTDAGNYSVVVTNAVGSVTSRVALLTFPSHSFDRIAANPDRTISLSLAGVVPIAFTPYYDLYPLDASTNFMDWSPLVMLQRTNSSSNALVYLDRDGTNFEKRFYRMHTNALITPLPKPSGPYPVGTISRLLTDPSRSNRYSVPTNSSFMVTIWYPAEARAGVLPEAYVESNATLHGYLNTRNPSIVAQFVSHALPGLPVATNQSSFPVVIYSHGGGFRRQNTDKALELASHGYVVVAVDHMWTTASVFPNGQVVIGQTVICADPKSCFQPFLDDGISDFRFVLDELSRLNINDALFAGRLDLGRLGAFGFSAGAVPVAEFCRIDARCKAVVLFDPGWIMEAPTDLNQFGLQKPFLSMNSQRSDSRPPQPASPPYTTEWLYGSLVLFTNAINDAFWFQIQDSTHQSFQDRGSLISDQARTADPTPVSREQSRTIRACMVSFFDKYLKGEDDHLLDNPAAVHPNIINFQSK